MTGTVWSIFLILSLCEICILFFCFLACCKQFFRELRSVLSVVDYAIEFSGPDIYCRVSYSCGTIDETKVSPFSPVLLFILSAVECRVFYFCPFFLYFFKPVFKHSGVSFKHKEHSQTQPLKRSLDKRVGGILMPGEARAFLYLTYYSSTSNVTVISITQNRSWNTGRGASVSAQKQLFE